jgi:hypothetical protein
MDDIWRGIQHATFADASDFSADYSRSAGWRSVAAVFAFLVAESSPGGDRAPPFSTFLRRRPAALQISWHAIRMRYELDREPYEDGGTC